MYSYPLPSTAAPARRGALVGALVLLFVGVSVHYSLKAVQHRSAFVRWQNQVLAMDAGEDISKKFNYPNPPVMAVLLLPLAWLPPLPGALAWFYLKAALTIWVIWQVFRLVEQADRPFPVAGQVLAVLLSLRPILGDLGHGNVNLFVLFLVVAALAAFRKRHNFPGGVLLGLAVSCKLTPVLFVPYLAWKRAWRALAGVGLGLALFLWPGVVPSLRLGFAENQRQLVSWYGEMVRPYLVEGKVSSEYPNQSLPGLVQRLMTASPSVSTYVGMVHTPVRYDNVLSLDPARARWFVKGCVALFALAAAWTCRMPAGTRGGWRLAAEYSLVLLGMLLFSGVTWKHHCVTLLLPFAVIGYYLTACRPGRARSAALVAVLAVTALLMTAAGTTPDKSFGRYAQVYGAYTAAHLLLAGTLVALLRLAAPEPASPSGSHSTCSRLRHGTGALSVPPEEAFGEPARKFRGIRRLLVRGPGPSARDGGSAPDLLHQGPPGKNALPHPKETTP
jgi:hypothetical protein